MLPYSEVARGSLTEIVELVESWCREMRTFLWTNNECENIIEGEIISE